MKPGREVVWVTGAGSGIGRELAESFARTGCSVAITSRTASQVKDIAPNAPRTVRCACDVRDSTSIRRAHKRITAAFGEVDVLVNNAGVTVFKEFLKTTEREFDDIIDTNLGGMFRATQEVLYKMVKRGKGTIVNILSFAYKTTYTDSAVYTASKSGGEALMRVLREELRGTGVRIINVTPGAVNTRMWSQRARRSHGSAMMSAKDVADEVVRLALSRSSVVPEEIVLRPMMGDVRL